MAKKLHFFILIVSLAISSFGQWQLISEIELPKKPSTGAIGIDGNLYLGYQDGSFVKYDPLGNELLNYSLSNQSPITLIEPQFQLKTFLFYFDNQLITVLDRFNTVPKNYPVRDFTSEIVSMACPAPDGSFWLVENNPLVLKRIDPNRKTLILETQPSLGREIRFLKAYQNILLLLDEKALHIFDQFGGLLFSLDVESNHLNIENDKVYLLSKDEILSIDPFKGEILSREESYAQGSGRFLKSNSRRIFLKGKKLFLYQEQN